MTHPGGLQAWRLAAWMVILEPAGASKWICVDFIDLGVFWGEKVSPGITRESWPYRNLAILEPPF